MTSDRRPGVTIDGSMNAGKAIPRGMIQINDCSYDQPRQIGIIETKLTLMPTAGGQTYHVYTDEPIKVENIDLDNTKTFQLWYYTNGGDLLAASNPIVLHPRQNYKMPNPHII